MLAPRGRLRRAVTSPPLISPPPVKMISLMFQDLRGHIISDYILCTADSYYEGNRPPRVGVPASCGCSFSQTCRDLSHTWLSTSLAGRLLGLGLLRCFSLPRHPWQEGQNTAAHCQAEIAGMLRGARVSRRSMLRYSGRTLTSQDASFQRGDRRYRIPRMPCWGMPLLAGCQTPDQPS